MQRGIVLGVLAAALLAGPAFADPVVVANFQTGFSSPTPGPGWSYYWNPANVPLTNASFVPNIGSWSPLVYNTTDSAYETASTGPAPQPGTNLSVNSTTITLGQGNAQAADGLSHYAILAYTFTPAEVAADGNDLKFHTYSFNIPTIPDNGQVDVEVFENSNLVFENPFASPTVFSDGTFGADFDFGTVNAGDTLYIAIGALGGDYTNQPLGVAYTLALVPEPGTIGLLAAAPLLMRRKRRSA